MCEINPKRALRYKLEFFTAKTMSDVEWEREVIDRLLTLEQEFNRTGIVRVHIHDEQVDDEDELMDVI